MSSLGKRTILILEDEINVGSTLKARLDHLGFDTVWVQRLSDARSAFDGPGATRPIDLAILDVNLPDGNGFEMGRWIRSHSPKTAILYLTAAGTPEDRIQGLEIGADDYVVKPFHFQELFLRIQNVLKRSSFLQSGTEPAEIKIGKAQVHFSKYQITLSDPHHSVHHLSHKECALLKLLFEKSGTVVSRDEILNLIWSEDEFPTPRTIDNFVLKLRKLIEPNPDEPVVIRSIRGVGYLLENISGEKIS